MGGTLSDLEVIKRNLFCHSGDALWSARFENEPSPELGKSSLCSAAKPDRECHVSDFGEHHPLLQLFDSPVLHPRTATRPESLACIGRLPLREHKPDGSKLRLLLALGDKIIQIFFNLKSGRPSKVDVRNRRSSCFVQSSSRLDP